MKNLLTIGLSLLLLGWQTALASSPAPGDADKLQGKWEMVEGEQNGEKFPEDFVKGFKLTFDKDKYDAKLAGGEGEDGTFKVDEKDTPKKSLTFTSGGSDVRKAIYEWDGEKLRICVSDRGGDKPKEFAGKDGNLMLVLKKAK